jgi:hypothetical protein
MKIRITAEAKIIEIRKTNEDGVGESVFLHLSNSRLAASKAMELAMLFDLKQTCKTEWETNNG